MSPRAASRKRTTELGCPVCTETTSVTETRAVPNGLRRRRRCVVDSCSGRLTTIELVAPDPIHFRGQEMSLIPKAELDALAALVEKLRNP